MKKVFPLLMFCFFAMCAMACSTDVESERLDEEQDALACAYPIGGVGSTQPPSNGGRITSFTVSGPKTMSVTHTAPKGFQWVGPITWDPASATSMSGGWAGTLLTKVSFSPCTPGMICMTLNYGLPDASPVVFGAGGAGAPAGSSFEMNQGVTKIEVVDSATGNYRALRFTGYHNGILTVKDRTFPGSSGC